METTKHPTKNDCYEANGYEFFGLFYKLKDGNPCRRVLDIRKTGCENDIPDLMVIMMNPGGSHPKGDKKYEHLKVINDLSELTDIDFVETIPDKTQYKVIEFMNKQKFNYARVLNLSDYCKTKIVKEDKWLFEKNSIFNNDQFEYANNYLKSENKKVLLAWGTDKYNIYHDIVSKAIDYFNEKNVTFFGYNKPNTNYYYHPLIVPNKYNKLKIWLEAVKELATIDFKSTPKK